MPIEHAAEAMRVIAEVTRSAPPELAIFAGGPSPSSRKARTSRRPAPRSGSGSPSVYQGSAEEAEPFIRPILALPRLGDTLGPKTYIETQEMSGRLPFGLRHYWKGHFVRDLDAPTIDAVVEGMSAGCGSSFVLLEAITGAARDEPAGGAAFGQRAAHWNISAIADLGGRRRGPHHIGWARAFTDALRPSSLSGAGYANYSPVDETPERVVAAFGAERYARLARVKRRYDPDNAFRFNLNIPPASAG